MEKIITSKGVMDILIPSGQRTDTKGELALVCPICSPERKDEHKNMKVFSVNMTKEPKPWRCNHCGEAGYVIDEEYMRRAKIKPILDFKKGSPFSAPMIKWFWDERRISEKTLNDLRITMSKEVIRQTKIKPGREAMKDTLASRSCINFRYYKENILINIKFRDQDKNFKMIKDATKIMYNLDSLKGQKKCVITEGEIDVASYHEAGIPWTVSVPNGVAITEAEKEEYKKTGKFRENLNMDYLDLCIDEFRDMDIIYIATDDDIPGLKLREELSRRLGKERCKYIKFSEYTKESGLPCKDANDVLVAKGKEFLARTLDYAYPFPVEGVTTAIQYWDKMESIFDNGRKKGFTTGYRCLDPHFNWMPGWLTMVNGYPGEGKALDIETDIPTPNGFVKMKDLKKGDKVYDEKGLSCNVINVTNIMNDRPCYKLTFSDGTMIKADEEHLWFVYNRESRASRNRHLKLKPRIASTTGVDQQHLMIKPKVVNTKFIFDNLKSLDSDKCNFSIDNTLPVCNDDKILPIHPYMLGVWLGDGTSSCGCLTISDKDMIEMIPLLKETGYTIRKRNTKYLYQVDELKTHLRKTGILFNKHIPDIYFTASYNQRLELLKGLMDTDGFVDEIGRVEISLSDEKLAKDTHALICSLGIKVSIVKNKSFLNGESKKDRYRMKFISNLNVFKLTRKTNRLRKTVNNRQNYRYITDCQKIESIPVKCIQVDSPNKLYLASKSYIPTHNSSWIFNMVLVSSILYDWKWGMYCPENYPPENIIDTLAEICVGDTADISFRDRMSKERYKDAIMRHINTHFFFVDNENGYNPSELRKIKKFLITQHGIRGFLTDPWKNLIHNLGNKSIDMYLQEELSAEVRLSIKNDLINLICHHPPTPPRDKDKNYPPPTQFELIGGQVWASTCYSMICIHKHDRTSWENTESEVHVQRNKEHKLVGFPTDRNNPVMMKFERRTNRFLEREVVTDLNTPYNKFPFKDYINNGQTILEGF